MIIFKGPITRLGFNLPLVLVNYREVPFIGGPLLGLLGLLDQFGSIGASSTACDSTEDRQIPMGPEIPRIGSRAGRRWLEEAAFTSQLRTGEKKKRKEGALE